MSPSHLTVRVLIEQCQSDKAEPSSPGSRVRYSSPLRGGPANTGLRQELRLAPRGPLPGNRGRPTRSAAKSPAAAVVRGRPPSARIGGARAQREDPKLVGAFLMPSSCFATMVSKSKRSLSRKLGKIYIA